MGLCPALVGQLLSMRLRKRVEILEKIGLMFSVIETSISFLSVPATELVQVLTGKEELRSLGFLMQCNKYISEGSDFREAWLNSLSAWKNTQYMNNNDVALLKLFCENFGISDVKGEISNCRFCNSLLKEHITEARLKKEKYGNIISGLGVFTGFALIVVLY